MFLSYRYIPLQANAFRGQAPSFRGNRMFLCAKASATGCFHVRRQSVSNRMLVTKALSQDVTLLTFVPIKAQSRVSVCLLFPLESPPYAPTKMFVFLYRKTISEMNSCSFFSFLKRNTMMRMIAIRITIVPSKPIILSPNLPLLLHKKRLLMTVFSLRYYTPFDK